ncbi:MAG: 2-oxo acid dehydrogenase subunit E2 [Holosporaceae bacterium]|jgi:pyruvate/2-oxoglutarate dehydrogenase complex dihydrolipoamide acyltransferase (E2) component|nr:2-oxo acid dehydrogenase subunit E2 [Holosporaceae bacterium]
MLVDIIVPNFDDTSYEVTLTAWYKKVGDKISKNEVIADAETSTVACGITSSYDCVLAKIIAKEGAVIPQGAKIAIIETEVNGDTELEEILEKSTELEETSKKQTKNLRNSHIGKENEELNDQPMEYSLSVSGSGDGEFTTPSDFDPSGVSPAITSFASSALEAMEEVDELREEIIEELSEETEEKFKNILRTTEQQAKEEAKKLKEKILDEAMKLALAQGEELKTKILKEYEQTALKDASEMHRKIIEGSITEAENTKNKLIIEAVEKAKEEAEILRQDIFQKAEEDAKVKAEVEAEAIKIDILKKAEETAIAEAEIVKRDILEKTEQEANTEAAVIRQDILQKTEEEAHVEAKHIEDSILEEVEREANLEAEEILEETLEEANAEAEMIEEAVVDNLISEYEPLEDIITEGEKEEDDIDIVALEIAEEAMAPITVQSPRHSSSEMHGKKNNNGAFTDNDLSSFSSSNGNGFMHNGFTPALDSGINAVAEDVLSSVRDEINRSMKAMLEEMKHLADSEIKKAISKIKETINAEEKACHHASKNHLGKRLVKEKVEELKAIDKTANKLLHTPLDDSSPEMYADNWNKPTFFSSPGDKKVPIDFLKQRINEKLKSSMDSSVISTVSNEVDMNAVLNLEKTFGKEFSRRFNTRLGFTPFFIIASISALKKYRMFNAHIHGNDLIYKNNYDISVITCGNDGVAAPVIRNADSLSIAEIERSMIVLSRRAVEGTLSLEEVSGGTFTVVNAGVYGSLIGTDLLTAPQVATLSVHRMHNRPVATDTGVEIKPMLYISLSYDHRIADTKTASEFLCDVKNYVENPGWTILGL